MFSVILMMFTPGSRQTKPKNRPQCFRLEEASQTILLVLHGNTTPCRIIWTTLHPSMLPRFSTGLDAPTQTFQPTGKECSLMYQTFKKFSFMSLPGGQWSSRWAADSFTRVEHPPPHPSSRPLLPQSTTRASPLGRVLSGSSIPL